MPASKIQGVFSTGQIAKMCGVAPRTVCSWIDSSRLQGAWRIPGSRDRRVRRADLVAFLQEHHMPLNGLASGPRVLLIGLDDAFAGQLAAALPGCDVAVALDGFQAGRLVERAAPDVAVVDAGVSGRSVAINLCAALRQTSPTCRIVGIATEDDADLLGWARCQRLMRRPVGVADVAGVVRAAVCERSET
jgi:hypothetical protein